MQHGCLHMQVMAIWPSAPGIRGRAVPSPGRRGESTFPRKRLVKACTRRFRGNVMVMAATAATIRDEALCAACECVSAKAVCEKMHRAFERRRHRRDCQHRVERPAPSQRQLSALNSSSQAHVSLRNAIMCAGCPDDLQRLIKIGRRLSLFPGAESEDQVYFYASHSGGISAAAHGGCPLGTSRWRLLTMFSVGRAMALRVLRIFTAARYKEVQVHAATR
jgi:hypothetical protein